MVKKNKKDYLDTVSPNIRKTLNFEQEREIDNLFKNCLPPPFAKHLIDLRFNFWFLKKWYVVIMFGPETRENVAFCNKEKYRYGIRLLQILFFIIYFLGTAVMVFLLLYIFKSLLGIDLISDFHLKDLWQ